MRNLVALVFILFAACESSQVEAPAQQQSAFSKSLKNLTVHYYHDGAPSDTPPPGLDPSWVDNIFLREKDGYSLLTVQITTNSGYTPIAPNHLGANYVGGYAASSNSTKYDAGSGYGWMEVRRGVFYMQYVCPMQFGVEQPVLRHLVIELGENGIPEWAIDLVRYDPIPLGLRASCRRLPPEFDNPEVVYR